MQITVPSLLRIKQGTSTKIGKYLSQQQFKNIAIFWGEGVKELLSERISISLANTEINILHEEIWVSSAVEKIFERSLNLSSKTQVILAIGGGKVSALSVSEIGTILIAFHLSDYRHSKHFYLEHVSKYLINDFPCLVSYNRFMELIPNSLIYLICFLNRHCKGECTGISFIDSTSLKVCHNKRIPSNKIFQGLATRGETSVDWFFGFKLPVNY